MDDRKKLTFGIALLVVGIAFLYVGTTAGVNVAELSTAGGVQSDEGYGAKVSTDIKSFPFLLSTAGQNEEFVYKVVVENTGSLEWSSWWTNTRICSADSTTTLKTDEGVEGSFLVCSCPAGTDDKACRENIESDSEWNMKISTSGQDGPWTDISDARQGDHVYTYTGESVEQGKTRAYWIKIDTPQTSKTYTITSNLVAYGGGVSKIVENKQDPLTIGALDGSMTFTAVGVVSSLASIALLGSRAFA